MLQFSLSHITINNDSTASCIQPSRFVNKPGITTNHLSALSDKFHANILSWKLWKWQPKKSSSWQSSYTSFLMRPCYHKKLISFFVVMETDLIRLSLWIILFNFQLKTMKKKMEKNLLLNYNICQINILNNYFFRTKVYWICKLFLFEFHNVFFLCNMSPSFYQTT